MRFSEKILLSACLVMSAFAGLAGQSPTVPRDALGPTLYNVFPRFTYAESYQDLDAVDFRNLRVHIFTEGDESHLSGDSVSLKDGKYRYTPNFGFEFLDLDSIYELGTDSSGRSFKVALYTYVYGGGSSNTEGIAQVFEFHNQRLSVRQQLRWDKHFESSKPYVKYYKATKTLVIRSAHYLPDDGHCCVSAAEVITLQWAASRFVRRSVHTELTEDGKRTGKKLP